MCNFVAWRNKKIIYKRYASLFSLFVWMRKRSD